MPDAKQKARIERAEVRREALKSPRAAAVAGIIFAITFTVSLVLIRLALPEVSDATAPPSWLQTNAAPMAFALTLVPFSGIAFLWFMGVVRDRVGKLEDQLFSTVFLGSGLLFLAMIFMSAAIVGGMLNSYAVISNTLIESGVIHFGRSMVYTITNVYAIRMAGVFMISLGSIWIRTRTMPRLFVFITYGFALVMLVAVNFTVWLILAFPAWVFVISVYILFVTMRGETAEAEGALGGVDD